MRRGRSSFLMGALIIRKRVHLLDWKRGTCENKSALIGVKNEKLLKGEEALPTKEKGNLSKYKGHLSNLNKSIIRAEGVLIRSEKGHFSYLKKGTYENCKWTHIGHILQGKMGTCRRKRGTCQNKRGTYHRRNVIGALFYVKWALFLCKKGHFSRSYRSTFPM